MESSSTTLACPESCHFPLRLCPPSHAHLSICPSPCPQQNTWGCRCTHSGLVCPGLSPVNPLEHGGLFSDLLSPSTKMLTTKSHFPWCELGATTARGLSWFWKLAPPRQLQDRDQPRCIPALTGECSRAGQESSWEAERLWAEITCPPRPRCESSVLGIEESVIGIATPMD